MSDPFVAEIRIFGFNFPPRGWAFCDGQLMPISQNTALFSLVGTFYGGDGKSTFAIPNLQGASPVQHGQGQGLSDRFLGEMGGAETTTLIVSEIPQHTHVLQANGFQGDNVAPGAGKSIAASTGGAVFASGSPPLTQMAPQALPTAGGSLPHNNLQPYLVLNFCIALQGIFPPR